MGQTLLIPKTTIANAETVSREWFLVDAKDLVLGRLASQIAMILMGKRKPSYTPFVDSGDFVIVVNADRVRLTGKKIEQKTAFRHTGHPGGARITPYKKLMETRPEKVIQMAVKRMLPKNRLASRQILRLKLYRGDSHPHAVQNPKRLEAGNPILTLS
ncbi:MAG: 50S ribosomal protein L13 [Elusimicrobia bacterium RIFCSPLOWO2_01_FULL_64_13]|nr:MAG: 50S ribosomal protein L13 [Elusimicrobia bacterium RIFCSPLOWO2_01_FULL_64_13]